MRIVPIEYMVAGRLFSKQPGDMGVPRVGEYVSFENDQSMRRETYRVLSVEWYDEPNGPRVFVNLAFHH